MNCCEAMNEPRWNSLFGFRQVFEVKGRKEIMWFSMAGLHDLLCGNTPIKGLGSSEHSYIMGLNPKKVHVCLINLRVAKFDSVFEPR